MTSSRNALRRPLCQRKFKTLVLLTGVVLVLFFKLALYIFFSGRNTREPELDIEKNIFLRKFADAPEEKIIHLDLKGAPPRIEYLLEMISLVKKFGATGILLEYEDMFPYKGDLEGISALNAYTPSDVAAIEETAKKSNISLIPLIPTLGHFEFVLKLEKYMNFREVESTPETLCPSQSGIYDILERMIDQVLEVHKNSKYVHIGCDQVKLIGVCAKCRTKMKSGSLTKNDIFLGHIRKVAGYINYTYPGVKAIIWGNNLINQSQFALLRHEIPDLVDIMLSNYEVDYNSFPSYVDMKFYMKLFRYLWVAGSFKGATGFHRIVPEVDFHLINSRFWKDFIEQWKTRIRFKGIVLMGWQRQSHFEVLTELLPMSTLSMAVNLQQFGRLQDFDYEMLRVSLTCNDFVPLNEDFDQLDSLHCEFPGFEVYRVLFHFFKSTVLIKRLLQNPSTKYLTFHNILHREWRPSYVRNFAINKYRMYIGKLIHFENVINAALTKLYDNFTVNEWITTYVIPLRVSLQMEFTALDALMKKKVWPRRPLVNDMRYFNAIFNNMCPENDTVKCSFALLPKFST